MSQLARLLGHDHPLFVYNLAQLEKATGHAGVDTRLIADMRERAHRVMRGLRLDPGNTHTVELYKALQAAVATGEAERLLADTAYVLAEIDGEVVSFNLQDVIENAHHELAIGAHTLEHAQRHLRAEIIRRYAEHDRTHDELVHALADEAGLKPAKDALHQTVPKKKGNPMHNSAPRILAIGDIFTDAFIKLNEDSAKIIKEEDGKEWLALPFGQKPPYDHVDIIRSVGPAPNSAVSVSRLGLGASLMAWVGGDVVGEEALEHLREERVGTDSMVVEPDNKTSYWYVLRYGADRTMLVRSEKYKYEWTDPAEAPDWIYLTYIGEQSWELHEKLLDYLERHPDTKLAFQPGTFHFQWGVEKLAGIYGRSEIVVMNREETVDVTGGEYDDLHGLAAKMHELGPSIVVITDGPHGSYASYDGKLVTIPNYPDIAPPLDRTGAGDAFASTIVAALALGETMETALTWAPINSMNVVQAMGAQAGLQTREQLNDWLAKAPEDYKVTELPPEA